MTCSKKQVWISIALINLCVVALLGVTLRSKILFPIQVVDFKYILHAHSHFAFGGWISLTLMTLLVYEILPEAVGNKKIYQWCLAGILFNAAGMLVSFILQGYAFFSILFSTLFIFVSYVFAFVFTRDIIRVQVNLAIRVLSISAMVCLVISSVGPFTLAYLMASHSGNYLLSRDAVYTYLHMQYNGFFALSVFALFCNIVCRHLDPAQLEKIRKFAIAICCSILPTLFISYLWHYTNTAVVTISVVGCLTIALTVYYLITVIYSIKQKLALVPRFTRNIALLSLIAFLLKSVLQTGTIIPWLGKLVYGDRAIIVGYLHLVLLGFITLYIFANLLYSGILRVSDGFTRRAVTVFVVGVVANEVILMVQGFGNMLMISNHIYSWLLWIASIWLFSGAVMIFISMWVNLKKVKVDPEAILTNELPLFPKQTKLKNYESGSVY